MQEEFNKKKHCISCGNTKEDPKKDFCEVCQALVDEEFHEITTEAKAKIFARNYLKHKLDYKERKYIKDVYEEHGDDSVIGVMPSQCPLCFRLSKNNSEFTIFKKDSKEYQTHVVEKKKLKAICGPCGNLAHFLKEFYDLDSDEINKLLKQIKKIKEARKNGKKVTYD